MTNPRYPAMFLPLLLMAALVGCTPSDHHTSAAAAADSSMAFPTAVAEATAVEDNLLLTGRVTFDQDHVVRVHALMSGVVERMLVDLGDHVRAGQPLAVIRSSDVMELGTRYSAARAALATAKTTLQNTEVLFRGGLTTDRDLEAARQDVERLQAEVLRLDDARRMAGTTDDATYTLKAPSAGVVVERTITQGSQFRADATEPLLTISNLSTVWILANVYETDVATVQPGSRVDVRTLAWPDDVIAGVVDRVYDVLDPENRTMTVRIRVDNRDNKLKPEMFATVTMHRREGRSLITIPTSATIFDQNATWVVVAAPDGSHSIRPITPYKVVGDHVFVRSGIEPGEAVVSGNQLLLYTALKRS